MRIFQLVASFVCLSFVACGSEGLAFSIAEKEAAPGEQVCVEVRAEEFTDILTMQYSIGWDDKVLRFAGVKDFGLPGMSEQNFGRPGSHPDRLTVSWFEPNLRAVSVTDGTPLFSLCFEVTGNSGQSSPVTITDDPTIIEVANAREEIMKPVMVDGRIVVK